MRPSSIEYFMAMAVLVGSRSTCLRRQVGCVLVDEHNHVLATGYNGPHIGAQHCNQAIINHDRVVGNLIEHPYACEGAFAPSGTQLDACQAIHAEQNAFLQCQDAQAIVACYVTSSPCLTCVKLLLNTPCNTVVFLEPYAHDAGSSALWKKAGRDWICYGNHFNLADHPLPDQVLAAVRAASASKDLKYFRRSADASTEASGSPSSSDRLTPPDHPGWLSRA